MVMKANVLQVGFCMCVVLFETDATFTEHLSAVFCVPCSQFLQLGNFCSRFLLFHVNSKRRGGMDAHNLDIPSGNSQQVWNLSTAKGQPLRRSTRRRHCRMWKFIPSGDTETELTSVRTMQQSFTQFIPIHYTMVTCVPI